jgi:hypothetical protein
MSTVSCTVECVSCDAGRFPGIEAATLPACQPARRVHSLDDAWAGTVRESVRRLDEWFAQGARDRRASAWVEQMNRHQLRDIGMENEVATAKARRLVQDRYIWQRPVL